jgi:hypothetical protein
LACGYTGGTDEQAIKTLKGLVGEYRNYLAMGVAIAANARHTVGNASHYVELACKILCGLSSTEASHMVDLARENLPPDGEVPAYEIWRQRLVEQFAAATAREVNL